MRSKDIIYANTNNYADDEDDIINIPLSVLEINEKSEQQLARTSTFYLPKYHDPQPGTTNDFVIGSLVEVLNDVSDNPLYGVVRWIGVENGTNFILVGIELEEEQSHLPLILTDGTHNGERLFKCAEKRALFVPLDQCHKDSRFQDVTSTPVHEASASKQIVVSFFYIHFTKHHFHPLKCILVITYLYRNVNDSISLISRLFVTSRILIIHLRSK